MDRPRFQFSLKRMLALVACVAVNLWLFRLGPLLGILGLNISKHVLIAFLCHAAGVDKDRSGRLPPETPANPTAGVGEIEPAATTAELTPSITQGVVVSF